MSEENTTERLDLSDERFHRARVPWSQLIKDGYDPNEVLVEAQIQGMWKLARSAMNRIENTSNVSFKMRGTVTIE